MGLPISIYSQRLLPCTAKPPGLLGIGAENITTGVVQCNTNSPQVNPVLELVILHVRDMTSTPVNWYEKHIMCTMFFLQDLIIFPGDAEFKRVSQCKTGRVFLLKFKDSSRKYFYWMQEPKEEKDEDFVKKVL